MDQQLQHRENCQKISIKIRLTYGSWIVVTFGIIVLGELVGGGGGGGGGGVYSFKALVPAIGLWISYQVSKFSSMESLNKRIHTFSSELKHIAQM